MPIPSMKYLRERMASWEYYTWTENIEMLDGEKATTREMFFYLHTDNGLRPALSRNQ